MATPPNPASGAGADAKKVADPTSRKMPWVLLVFGVLLMLVGLWTWTRSPRSLASAQITRVTSTTTAPAPGTAGQTTVNSTTEVLNVSNLSVDGSFKRQVFAGAGQQSQFPSFGGGSSFGGIPGGRGGFGSRGPLSPVQPAAPRAPASLASPVDTTTTTPATTTTPVTTTTATTTTTPAPTTTTSSATAATPTDQGRSNAVTLSLLFLGGACFLSGAFYWRVKTIKVSETGIELDMDSAASVARGVTAGADAAKAAGKKVTPEQILQALLTAFAAASKLTPPAGQPAPVGVLGRLRGQTIRGPAPETLAYAGLPDTSRSAALEELGRTVFDAVAPAG